MPATTFALKSPPRGAPCKIEAPPNWTFCPFAGLAGRNLVGANLYFATLDGAHLTRVTLDRADLSFTYFYEAKLGGATFFGATFAYTVCPSGKITSTGCR